MIRRSSVTRILLLTSACLFASAVYGEHAPSLSGVTLDGQRLELDPGGSGVPHLLVAWASWCGVCKQEVPAINALQREIGDSLRVVGINVDLDRERGVQAQKSMEMSYPSFTDPELRLSDLLGIRGTPGLVLIDGTGVVIERGRHLDGDMRSRIQEAVLPNNP